MRLCCWNIHPHPRVADAWMTTVYYRGVTRRKADQWAAGTSGYTREDDQNLPSFILQPVDIKGIIAGREGARGITTDSLHCASTLLILKISYSSYINAKSYENGSSKFCVRIFKVRDEWQIVPSEPLQVNDLWCCHGNEGVGRKAQRGVYSDRSESFARIQYQSATLSWMALKRALGLLGT